MKTTLLNSRSILSKVFVAMAIIMASCSSEEDLQPNEENNSPFIGEWEHVQVNEKTYLSGVLVDEHIYTEQITIEFFSDWTFLYTYKPYPEDPSYISTTKGTYLHENNILTLVTTWTYDGRNIGERETVEYYFENGRLFLPNNSSYDRDGKRYDVESFSEYKRK